jgi:hypothetical protein
MWEGRAKLTTNMNPAYLHCIEIMQTYFVCWDLS